MRFTFDVEREEKIGFLMSNKRFRFDKKKSTRNKKIGWSDSLSVICRHILMPLRSQRAETRKQLNQTSLWTYFFYIFLCSAKTKPMKTIVFVYFYWMFHSKKERKCNAVLRKQLAFVAYIENEEGKTRTLNPSMQRDATPKITKYLCRLYYTIYALIMSAQPISNWIVCVWKWLERVFFSCMRSTFFELILTAWIASHFDSFFFYSDGLVFGLFEMSITIVVHVSIRDLNETTQWKRPAGPFICLDPKIMEKRSKFIQISS